MRTVHKPKHVEEQILTICNTRGSTRHSEPSGILRRVVRAEAGNKPLSEYAMSIVLRRHSYLQ